jgi:hypothetical protein
MLCYAVLCYVMLYYVRLGYVIFWYVILDISVMYIFASVYIFVKTKVHTHRDE